MKRFKFQIGRAFSYISNSGESTERIDLLLMNFEKSIKEMKKYLQESGYSRRYFITGDDSGGGGGISDRFKDESLKFKETIMKRSNELNEFEFCKSILSLGSIFRWKEAEIVFKEGKLKYSESSDIYSSMIYSYGKVGNYFEALKLFEEASLKNILNKEMFEGLLEAFSVHVEKEILKANSIDENNLNFDSIYRQIHLERILLEISMEPALKIYSKMLKLNFIPNISTLTRIIRLAGRLRRFSIIEDIQREIERFSLKFDARAYEVLIFAQMNCGRSDEAEETLKRALNDCIVEEYSRLLNVMLFGYCRLRRPLEANRLLEIFEGLGVQPSNSAISFLVGTAAKCGFINDAESYFRKLKLSKASNLLIPAANHLLSAYLREDNYEKFFNLIDELGLERDKYTNTMLFDALSRCKDHQKDQSRLSKEIELTKLHVMKSNLSPMELSSLFKCLFSHFEGDDRHGLIKEFTDYVIVERSQNNENRKEIEIILLDVFSKLKDWNKCIELVKSLIKIKAEPLMFSKLMTAAGPNPEKIEFVLNWMKSSKCWRDPAILTAAMQFYWQAGCSIESRELWNEIKSKRNKARSFSIAISVMAQILLKEEGPISSLNHLNNYKTLWNDESIQVYLKSLRLSGLNQSKEIETFFFEKVIKMNQPPSIEVCNEILISILPKKEILNRIINWMCKSGCHPNVQTMNILLGCDCDLRLEAENLLDEMIKVGGRPSDELLLRMISGILENSNSISIDSSSKAESYSKILLNRSTDQNPEIKLNLFLIWKKYFEKSGQVEKVERIKIEIDKILK